MKSFAVGSEKDFSKSAFCQKKKKSGRGFKETFIFVTKGGRV